MHCPQCFWADISIRGSRVGPDNCSITSFIVSQYFNPRVPCGTRLRRFGRRPPRLHFNPRVPCGTRPCPCPARTAPLHISIRGSRVGPDLTAIHHVAHLSIISIRGSRVGPDDQHRSRQRRRKGISIRGSRVGPDCHPYRPWESQTHFNPRVPCGTRLFLPGSTNSVMDISIRGSRVGPDCFCGHCTASLTYFNPRVPCGTRPVSSSC